MRVVVGEDETLLRRGLVLLLEAAGHAVVGEAADADAVVRLVDEVQPDLLVTDIRMPPRASDDGLLAALEVRRRHPEIGIVVLSQHVQRGTRRSCSRTARPAWATC
jgi:DNA-binding NarL/FixJ family response regulator